MFLGSIFLLMCNKTGISQLISPTRLFVYHFNVSIMHFLHSKKHTHTHIPSQQLNKCLSKYIIEVLFNSRFSKLYVWPLTLAHSKKKSVFSEVITLKPASVSMSTVKHSSEIRSLLFISAPVILREPLQNSMNISHFYFICNRWRSEVCFAGFHYCVSLTICLFWGISVQYCI